jgi:tRNA threonylcarbamoyladenosine biosynthesis protein TsaB
VLRVLAGNVFAVYGARLPDALLPRVDALPRAQALLRLAPALLAAGGAVAPAQALPTYVRDKVAQTTRERAAARLADIRP